MYSMCETCGSLKEEGDNNGIVCIWYNDEHILKRAQRVNVAPLSWHKHLYVSAAASWRVNHRCAMAPASATAIARAVSARRMSLPCNAILVKSIRKAYQRGEENHQRENNQRRNMTYEASNINEKQAGKAATRRAYSNALRGVNARCAKARHGVPRARVAYRTTLCR